MPKSSSCFISETARLTVAYVFQVFAYDMTLLWFLLTLVTLACCNYKDWFALDMNNNTSKTTAYDAYGNNVATKLLAIPYERQHFAYAKPCFRQPLSLQNTEGVDLRSGFHSKPVRNLLLTVVVFLNSYLTCVWY